MKKTACIILFNLFIICLIYSQNSIATLKKDFLSAESYLLFEEYNEALPLYLKLIRTYPENDNFNYKIGLCYLNNPYEKDKSIYYLEKAIKNINLNYKNNSFRESSAPLEALYYLGNAYRVNNQLNKAREFYNNFLKQLDPAEYKVDLVKDQLAACDAAEKLMMNPVDIDSINQAEPVNTRFAEMNPVISGDESKMAYVSKLQFYDAVFYTEKRDGKWSYPRNILPELGEDADVYPTCMSFDGKNMYVYRNDDFLGTIYTTKLVNGMWTPLVKLNENINTKYWESHASISKDGNILYFTSNRKDGYGGLDIYYSKKMHNGDWGPAKNLGPVINTKYNEDTPFISEDDSRLFFSSYGHYNMGGYDIFMSLRINDTLWTEPENLGYPLNTTDDDLFFNPVANGRFAYYSMFDEAGFGRHDIYRYVIYTADYPRKYSIRGQVDYSGSMVDSSELLICIVDSQKNDTLAHIHPDSTGSFIFMVPAGHYDLICESRRFEKITQSIIVDKTTPHSGIVLTEQLILKPISTTLPLEDIDQPLEIGIRSRIYAFKSIQGTNIVLLSLNDRENDIAKSVSYNLYKISHKLNPERERNNIPEEFPEYTRKNAVNFELTNSDAGVLIPASYKSKPAQDDRSRDTLIPQNTDPSTLRKSIFYSILTMSIITFIIIFLILLEHRKRKMI